MRLLTPLPQDDLHDARAAAVAAEAAGYDGVVTMENRNEPFLALGVAAVATTRVELHTGIAIAFARSPMAVAQVRLGPASSASRGRFVLGLGSQMRAHNENRFSVPWSAAGAAAARVRRGTARDLAGWETGDKLAYRGQHYRFTLMTPNFTPRVDRRSRMVPVTIAAVGPAMLRLAGEVCDGVRLHGFCTRRYLDEVVLRSSRPAWRGAAAPREHFEISGGGFIATGPDEAAVAKRMVEWVRYARRVLRLDARLLAGAGGARPGGARAASST